MAAWYWSGMQRGFNTVTEDIIEQVKQDFHLQAPQIVYRYCGHLAAQAREIVSKHYQQFMDYFGKDLVIYPDGNAMADDMRKFHQYQFDSAPKQEVEAFLQKHHLAKHISKNRTHRPISLNAMMGLVSILIRMKGKR